MFKFITTNNVTSCPLSAPFVLANSTICQQCNGSTPIYDANLMICVAGCSPNTVLNSSLKTCQLVSSNLTCKYTG